jgi:hypothetical protein
LGLPLPKQVRLLAVSDESILVYLDTEEASGASINGGAEKLRIETVADTLMPCSPLDIVV